MHYDTMRNPLTILSYDSSASAKIIVDYVKLSLTFVWITNSWSTQTHRLLLTAFLTFFRHVTHKVGFATEHSYIRHAFINETVSAHSLRTEVHSLHWNGAFHKASLGLMRTKSRTFILLYTIENQSSKIQLLLMGSLGELINRSATFIPPKRKNPRRSEGFKFVVPEPGIEPGTRGFSIPVLRC